MYARASLQSVAVVNDLTGKERQGKREEQRGQRERMRAKQVKECNEEWKSREGVRCCAVAEVLFMNSARAGPANGDCPSVASPSPPGIGGCEESSRCTSPDSLDP